LRELDLEFTLTAARVLREHVENEHGAIDDWNRNDFFEIFALARTQIVEYEHQRDLTLFGDLRYFVRFAAADERCRIDRGAALHDALDDLGTRCRGKRFEFEQFRFERPARVLGVDSYDDGARRRYAASRRKRAMSQDNPSL
jgi:hypothetical protein